MTLLGIAKLISIVLISISVCLLLSCFGFVSFISIRPDDWYSIYFGITKVLVSFILLVCYFFFLYEYIK